VVAQFLRLKLRLLGNTFRRSPWQVFGILIASAYGLGIAVLAVAGLIALRSVEVPVATGIVVAAGSLVVLGFLLVPLAFGVDDTLDPRSFSLFGMPSGRLAVGLALTGLIGVPATAIAIVAVAQIVTWARSPLAITVAVLSAVLIVTTCVLGSRVTTSLASFVLTSRRAKEVTGVIALLFVVSLAPVIAVLATVDWARHGLDVLTGIAEAAAWTPFGAVWAAPASVAAGHAGTGVLQLIIAIAFVAVLWYGWRALVERMLVTEQRMPRERSYSGLGWFERLPATPSGVIAARSITYWLRDPRYRASLVAIPVAPLVFVFALGIAGVPWHVLALVPVPVICLFLAWSIHNDVAHDNTAIWLHVASNTSGSADRFGRVVPVLIVGVPLVLVGSVVSAALYGEAPVLLSLIGVSSCLLLAGLGLSSVISARFPYPAVRPGDSPFAQPQAAGSGSGLIQSLTFLATLLVAVIPAGFAALGFAFGIWGHLLALVSGLLLGVGGLILGVKTGGRVFSRRAPELLAFTQRN
jgi:ABC-2 type transport system permease protein